MPLKYLIDEHLRGHLIKAMRESGIAKGYPVDACEVGQVDAPPCRTRDSDLLIWCEKVDRVLISRDYGTLPGHLADHLAAERSSPGVFLVRANSSWRDVLNDLVYLAVASAPHEWRNRIVYVPL